MTQSWTVLLAGAVVGILAYLLLKGILRGVRRSFGAGSEAGGHKADLLRLQHDEVKARNEHLQKEQDSLFERRRALSEMNEMLLAQKQELETQAQELALSVEEYERLGQLTAWQQEELAERNEALERQTATAERLSKELAGRVGELNRAMAQIDRMHRDQESFLRHELRNAISPILGYSAMLRSDTALNGDTATWLEGIHEAAESMERLLAELRDLQAIERGGRAVGQSNIDLDDLVLASVRTVDPTGSSLIETRVEPIGIRGDAALLPGVFVNLIRNAVEHNQGIQAAVVSVEARVEGAWATVRIRNGGPPVPEARLATFFERFNSTKEGGTGLGTCYADLVVRAHGGTAEVEARVEGAWATVRIRNGGPPVPEARLATFFERFNSTKEGGTGLGTCYADLVVRAHGGTAEVSSGPDIGTVVIVRLPITPEFAPEPTARSGKDRAG